MTELELKSGFYNAVMVDGEPDRTYNAEDVNEHLEGLVSDSGIYANISTACQVLQGTGMQVIVKAGRGKVNNHWFKVETDTTIDISTADVILNRIDRIVIRYSGTDRNAILTVKEGVLASEPVAPALTRTEEVYEICLANILVNKNVTTISQSAITDTRPDNSVCGWITGLIDQIDTTTLYNQYETAQNEFISEKTVEFANWFETIKDDVRATNLYREYQEVYRSNVVGQQEIEIPSSINYVHNGLDVLNVFINGMRLLKDVEYTINSTGTSITLTTPLDVASQDVEFINKKSVEGTVAESTVLRVETLEEKVAEINKYVYEATGTNDNIILAQKVVNFLNGTGDFSTVTDNASLFIEVHGTLGLNYTSDTALFDFQNTNASNRKVYIDFRSATIPYSQTVNKTTYALFYQDDNVTIIGANVKIDNIAATTLYGFHGGIIKECNVTGTNEDINTFYGAWGCQEISYTNINVTYPNVVYGAYSCTNVLYNKFITHSMAEPDESIYSCVRAIGNDYNGTITSTIDLGNRYIN